MNLAYCLYMAVLSLHNIITTALAEDNSDIQPCIFPFIYGETRHTTCISLNHDRLWCSTTENYDQDKKWRDCTVEEIESLPTFDLTTDQNVTILSGDSARLPCVVANLYDKQIVWQRKGSQYPLTVASNSFLSSGKYIVERIGNYQWNLIIHNTRRSDGGKYLCKVTTKSMLLVREIQLNIIGDDVEVTSVRNNQYGQPVEVIVTPGSALELKCNSTDVTRVTETSVVQHSYIQWYKDGDEIDSNSKNGLMITNHIRGNMAISVLTKEETADEDLGTYVCISADRTNAKFNIRFPERMAQDEPSEQNQPLPTEMSRDYSREQYKKSADNHSISISFESQQLIIIILIAFTMLML